MVSYFMSLDIENSLSEPRAKLRPRLRKWISQKKFFKIPLLDYRTAAAQIVVRWPYRLPIKNLKTLYKSQFGVNFNFFCAGSLNNMLTRCFDVLFILDLIEFYNFTWQ